MKALAYDIEVTRNYFGVCFVDLNHYLEVFKDCVDDKQEAIPLIDKLSVTEIKNRLATVKRYRFSIFEDDDSELYPLLNWLQYEADYFGYNNNKYDRLMLSALLMYYNQFDKPSKLIEFLYDTSQRIIRNSDNDVLWQDNFTNMLMKNRLNFRDLDLFQIFRLDHFHKSLKQTSINIKWYNLLEYHMPPISELDVDYYYRLTENRGLSIEQLNRLYRNSFERYLHPAWKKEMEEYNNNDVFICCELVRMNQEEIRLRYMISKEYEINVLSASRSTIADKVIVKLYSKFTGLHPKQFIDTKTIRRKIEVSEILSDKIQFLSPQLNDLLQSLRSLVLRGEKGEFERTFTYAGTSYTLATGGLHSNEISAIYVADDKQTIVDRDVN